MRTTFYIFFVVTVFVSVLLMVFFFIFAETNTLKGFGFLFDSPSVAFPTRPVVLSLSTILGIFSRIFFEELRRQKERKTVFYETLKASLTSRDFWMAMAICPIVIGYVFKQFESISENASLAFIAYQNGFFFKSILAIASKEKR